jgi:hypothetical protein
MCVDDRCIRGNRYHGGLTPPALVLRCERLPAKNDFFDAPAPFAVHRRTFYKSGGCQPAVGVQTASAMAMRGISVIGFAFREHTTGGLTPPALVLRCERLPAKNDFFDAQTRKPKGRRASARRGSVNRTLCRENRTLSSGCRTRSQERRASARRGCANAHRRTRAPFTADRQRCVCMCVDDRCIRGNRYHGGLTPPALALRCERLPAKNDFFDAQTRNPKERQPAVVR